MVGQCVWHCICHGQALRLKTSGTCAEWIPFRFERALEVPVRGRPGLFNCEMGLHQHEGGMPLGPVRGSSLRFFTVRSLVLGW